MPHEERISCSYSEGGDTPRYIIFTSKEDVFSSFPAVGNFLVPPGAVLIPRARDETHYIAHESITVIPREFFNLHQSIVELICHAGVEKIEVQAFFGCHSLRRVIITGVKELEGAAFQDCIALMYVACEMLELIRARAFYSCKSLRSINLLSAKIVSVAAFLNCVALMDVTFGSNLESIEGLAFGNCTSLERITIPLKNGLISSDDVFAGCENLKRVDLVEGVVHQTITAFQLEEWRNDMNEEIDSINHTLSTAAPGQYANIFEVLSGRDNDAGGKALAIRAWISRVLRKIIDYKSQHRRLLENEVAAVLQLVLPEVIVMNNVLPFLELPLHKFDGEYEWNDVDNSEDSSEYTYEYEEDEEMEDEDY